MKRLLLIFAFALLCTFGNLFAAVPTSFNYQGVLVDNNNLPYSNGTYDLTFNLYGSAVGGQLINTHTATVTLENGYFNAILNNIDPTNFDTDIWVEVLIKINGVPTPIEPRVKLASVPFAIKAENANTALKADTANYAVTAGTAAYATAAHLADTANFAVPMGKADGANSDLIGNYPDGLKIKEEVIQGLIRSVLGPANGDITGTYPLLYINDGAVQTKHLADNSVTTDKLAAGAITTDKIATGTITVSNLNPNEFLYWDKDYRNDVQIDTQFDGDVTGTYNSINIKPEVVTDTELSTVAGLTPGTYNSSSKIYGFDVNSKGRVTKVYQNDLSATALIPGTAGQVIATGADGLTAWKSVMVDGNQLTGNGITSNLDIKAGGVGNNELADGAVSASKVDATVATKAQLDASVATLNTAITGEATARTNADTQIVSEYMTADATLNTAIITERDARIAADGTINTALANEVTARTNAISAETAARIAGDALKQNSALATDKMWIGDINGVAAAQTLSGDVHVAVDGTTKVQPSVITSVEIADGAVGNTELAPLSITFDKIYDRTIKPTKLEGTSLPNQYLVSNGNGGVIWSDGNFTLPYDGDYSPSAADKGGFRVVRKTNSNYDPSNASSYSYASAITAVNESMDGYAGLFTSTMVNPNSATLKAYNMGGGKALDVIGSATFNGSNVTMNSVLNVNGATGGVTIEEGKITGKDISKADGQYTLTTRNYVDNEVLNSATDIKSYGYLTVTPETDLPNSKIISVDANTLTIAANDISKTVTIGVKTAGITANEIADGTITNAEIAPSTQFALIQDQSGYGFALTEAAPAVKFEGTGMNNVTVNPLTKKVTIDGRATTDNSTILGNGADQAIKLNLGKANVWTAKQTFNAGVVANDVNAGAVTIDNDLLVGGNTTLIGTVNGYESPVLNPLVDLGTHSLAVNDKDNKFSAAQTLPKVGVQGAAQRTALINSLNSGVSTSDADKLSAQDIAVDGSTIKNDGTGQLIVPIDNSTIKVVGGLVKVDGSNVSNIDGTKIQAGTVPATALNVVDFANWNKDAANSVMKNTAITDDAAALSDATVSGNVLNGLNIQYKLGSVHTGDIASKAITTWQVMTNDETLPLDPNAADALRPQNLNKGGNGTDFGNWEKNSAQTVHTFDKIVANVGDVVNTTNAVYGNFSLSINPAPATGGRIITAINAAPATSTIPVTRMDPTGSGVLTTNGTAITWSQTPTLTDLTLTGKLSVNGATATIVNGALGDANPVKVNDELTVTGLSTLAGATLASGNLTVATGNVAITAGNLNVAAGTTTLNGATTINGVTAINNNLTVDAHPVAFGGTLGVTGATTLAGSLSVAGAVSNGTLADANPFAINDNATIAGTLTVAGATALNGGLTLNNSNLMLTGTSVIKNDGVLGNTAKVRVSDDVQIDGDASIANALTVATINATTINVTNLNANLTNTAMTVASLAVTGNTTLSGNLAISQNAAVITDVNQLATATTKTVIRYNDPSTLFITSGKLPLASDVGRIMIIVNETGAQLNVLGSNVGIDEAVQLICVNKGTNVWVVLR